MSSRENVLAHIQTVLDAGPEHPFFAKALEYVKGQGRLVKEINNRIEQNETTLQKAEGS